MTEQDGRRGVGATLEAEHPGLDLGRGLAPEALGVVPRFRLVAGEVVRLDQHLLPVATGPFTVAAERLLAVRDDFGVVVAASGDELVIVADGWEYRLEVGEADSAAFVSPTDLVVTAPTGEGDHAHRVLLVDVATGEVADEVVVAVYDARMSAVPHPTDGSVVLDAGEGQDGSHVFVARAGAGRLVVAKRAENVPVSGFDATGERLLLTPHPSFDTGVQVVAWPALEPMVSATNDQLGAEVDFYGCFLDDRRVLLRTYDDDLLLCDDRLRPIGRVELGSTAPVESVRATGGGCFAVDRGEGGRLPATVWSLDPEG